METIKFLLLLLLLTVLGGGGALWVWGGGDGRYTGEGYVTVSASRDVVTQWLLEPELRTRWIDGLSESRREGWGRWEKGARLEETLRRGERRAQRVVEVVEIVEGQRVVLKTEEDGVAITRVFELKAHNTGRSSRVTYRVEAVFAGFWSKLFEQVLGNRLLDRLRADLERLDALDKIA